MIIDTHCHLDFKDFDIDRDEVIDRAVKKGVVGIIDVGSSVEGSHRALELAKAHDIVYATIGVHPHEAKTVTDNVISEFRRLAAGGSNERSKIVAIGEVGLDFYRNLSPREGQEAAFKKFIYLARDLDLPIIIHAREAEEEVLSILKKEVKSGLKGVMHCFSGDKDTLKRCLDMGLYVSFTCNLTFKNAEKLREVAREVPIERLLLETDAPFLAPQELRGKRNEPAYLTYLIDEWSRLLNLSATDIARITTHNANLLFKLKSVEGSKIAYQIRESLYLNITNRCTNNCNFCIRTQTQFIKGHNLMLEKEPSVADIIKAVGDAKRYREIVFCGYGEPTIRLDVVKAVAKDLKSKGAKIRMVTNGHGDLINSRPIAAELAGLIDRVSVSLNAEEDNKYNEICKPKFGPRSYKHVLEFIKACVDCGIDTEVTCLNLPEVDVKKCETIAGSLGARFRLRLYGVAG